MFIFTWLRDMAWCQNACCVDIRALRLHGKLVKERIDKLAAVITIDDVQQRRDKRGVRRGEVVPLLSTTQGQRTA